MLARAENSQTKRAPERTCAGCRKVASPAALVRLVLGPDGQVVPDLAQRSFGRGAWVHPRPECIRDAAPRGLSKSFKASVVTRPEELHGALVQAATRRAETLLLAAWRAGKLAVGGTETTLALGNETARLVVVARDARAAADLGRVRQAVAEGLAVAFGEKALLGQLTGRSETGVVAVLDAGLATALSHMFEMIFMPEPGKGTAQRVAREDG